MSGEVQCSFRFGMTEGRLCWVSFFVCVLRFFLSPCIPFPVEFAGHDSTRLLERRHDGSRKSRLTTEVELAWRRCFAHLHVARRGARSFISDDRHAGLTRFSEDLRIYGGSMGRLRPRCHSGRGVWLGVFVLF